MILDRFKLTDRVAIVTGARVLADEDEPPTGAYAAHLALRCGKPCWFLWQPSRGS